MTIRRAKNVRKWIVNLSAQPLFDLFRGITRKPFTTAGYMFSAFSVMYTLCEGANHFVPGIIIEGKVALAIIIAISICFSLKKVWKPSKAEIKVANCNTIIELVFGDIFDKDGIRAIAVNEYFDSRIGNPVSEKSLHGIFIKKCFGGYPDSFDKQIDNELKSIQGEITQKTDGKAKKFPIGTTALILVNQDKYIVFALCETDPQTCKASSDVTKMWDSLNELWKRARVESGGHDLNLPLVGSGLSGLGLPTRDLLNLIILSAITETKNKEITQRIRVVLHRSKFDDIDLRDIKQYWERT